MKMTKKKTPIRVQQGLTLVELLLAAALFSVIGAILYSILSQGIRLWQHSEKDRDKSSEERIVLSKIANDIRTASIHQWVRFVGEADQIYFCGLRHFNKEDASSPLHLAKVNYYFLKSAKNSQKKGLYLAEYPIEYSFSDTPPPGKLFSTLFKDFYFEYGYWDSEDEKIVMKKKWNDPKTLPRLVVLKAQSDQLFSKTVVLPSGELVEINEKDLEDE